MAEKDFWAKIRPFLQYHTLYLARIENRVSQGIPDVFCMDKNKNTIWIELKQVSNIEERPKFQKSQPVWHINYNKVGGRSIIIVDYKDGIYAIKGSKISSLLKSKEKITPDWQSESWNKTDVNLMIADMLDDLL